MNKFMWKPIAVVLVLAAAIVGLATFTIKPAENTKPSLDAFAQCMTQKGATMYGAYWCPHCQEEKADFGSSFEYINYVECTQETDKCIAAGITGYPTWTYPDGKTYMGTQSLQQLAGESGCELPAGY